MIVCASSAAAAELIGGITVHSAFKLDHRNGSFLRSRLCEEAYSDHFMTIFKCDIIVIDEISMLTAGALEGVQKATSFVKSMGTSTYQTQRSFGACSVVAVGDLYQLPAVQSCYREEQVYMAAVWPEFRLFELTENCRSVGDQALAAIQHKIRDGPENLTEDDWALLETRLCINHCPPEDLIDFQDEQEIHKSNVVNTKKVCHCPFKPGAMCLAARRNKVDAIVEAWAAAEAAANPNLHIEYAQALLRFGTSTRHSHRRQGRHQSSVPRAAFNNTTFRGNGRRHHHQQGSKERLHQRACRCRL